MIYFPRKVFKCNAKNQNNMRVACPMPEKSRYSVQIFVTKPKCPKSCVRNFLNIWDSLEVWSSLRQSCYNHTASFPPAAALRIRIPFQIRSSIRMLPPAQVGNVFINVVLKHVSLPCNIEWRSGELQTRDGHPARKNYQSKSSFPNL